MDYEQYIDHFKKLSGLGHVELHVAFEVLPSDKNPNYLQSKIQDIELRIRQYEERTYPGIKYKREGPRFWIDMIAYKTSGHLDYLDRARQEITPFFNFKPIENQLKSPDTL